LTFSSVPHLQNQISTKHPAANLTQAADCLHITENIPGSISLTLTFEKNEKAAHLNDLSGQLFHGKNGNPT
jgi:hypothetical protein